MAQGRDLSRLVAVDELADPSSGSAIHLLPKRRHSLKRRNNRPRTTAGDAHFSRAIADVHATCPHASLSVCAGGPQAGAWPAPGG